ncbi:hypothetical protein LTR94_034522, partial [Friedmanniomyces endolithicus]
RGRPLDRPAGAAGARRRLHRGRRADRLPGPFPHRLPPADRILLLSREVQFRRSRPGAAGAQPARGHAPPHRAPGPERDPQRLEPGAHAVHPVDQQPGGGLHAGDQPVRPARRTDPPDPCHGQLSGAGRCAPRLCLR